jgi:NADPH:quinone reductase-like Zn-dependent oxidoreductase
LSLSEIKSEHSDGLIRREWVSGECARQPELSKGYRLLAPTGRLGMFGISSAVTQNERRVLDMLGMLARMPWFQFNPLSLISANKGVFGVNLGHLWGEIDRIRGGGEQLLDLWTQGAIKPKIARSFTFNEAADAHHFIQDRKNIGKVLLVP